MAELGKEQAWSDCVRRLRTSCSSDMLSTLRRYFDEGYDYGRDDLSASTVVRDRIRELADSIQ